MRIKEKTLYPGDHIDVEWDGRLCIHVAECGKSHDELFIGGRKPWCDPDLASTQQVREVVERCPTGALTYLAKDDSPGEHAAAENTVTVAYNGPYFFQGDLDIENIPADMPGVAYRAALCRCGASSNKPFCDGSHKQAGFKSS